MNPTTKNFRRGKNFGRGFTIIELLIAMAVIFLLVSLVVVALASVKKAANRTDSANALKQMVIAYSSYYQEHDGRFMPGYIDPALLVPGPNQIDIKARAEDGSFLTPADTASYVWRLSPYLDHAWKTYLVDYRSEAVEEGFENNINTIATSPSFGMNSIFVGGDTTHGGSSATPYHPWNMLGNDSIAAVRLSEVKRPAKLIVFAPTQSVTGTDSVTGLPIPLPNSYDSTILGYMELRPPYVGPPTAWTTPQWSIGTAGGESNGEIVPIGSIDPAGVLIGRWEDEKVPGGDSKIPTGNLDGSVSMHTPSEFVKSNPPFPPGYDPVADVNSIMTYWSPFSPGGF